MKTAVRQGARPKAYPLLRGGRATRPDGCALPNEAASYRANFGLGTLAGYYALRARTVENPRRISLLAADDRTRDPRAAPRCHRCLLSVAARGSVCGFSEARAQSRRP